MPIKYRVRHSLPVEKPTANLFHGCEIDGLKFRSAILLPALEVVKLGESVEMKRNIAIGTVAVHFEETQVYPRRNFQVIAVINHCAIAFVAGLFFSEHSRVLIQCQSVGER